MNTTQYVIARNGGVGISANGSLGHNAHWKSTDRNQQIDYQKIIIKSIKSYLKDRDKAFQDEFENYIKNDVISA